MKNLYKNSTLYYILIPVLVGIWPLLVWATYLPDAKRILGDEVGASGAIERQELKILRLDPDRLDFADANDAGEDFSYPMAVDKVAGLCSIPASKYKLNTGMKRTKDGQESQTARLRIEQVSIVQFARFLSLAQLRWGTLQCDSVTLTKVEAEAQPDIWTVEVDFNYYY